MSEGHYESTFQAPELEEVAQLFSSYKIHSLIACGGMGAVYQATQRSLERIVAIKILPREFSTDEAFRAGFESEAKAMARLNHPNLIGVYDFGETGGMLYIIMEFVAGKSLFESAHGFAVDQSEAIPIVVNVCNGLAHAHEHGILHRDIKPSNIFLDANTIPKIGDFGLARKLGRQIEEGEQIFGTPDYTAPEVLVPPFAIDQRADIYSVGVMLHELLTGRLPGADPRPASQICGCSQQLDSIILRSLHPNPNFRYHSITELADDLTKVADTPTQSRGLLTAPQGSTSGRALTIPARSTTARSTAMSTGLRSPIQSPSPARIGGTKPSLGRSSLSSNSSAKKSSAMPVILICLVVAAAAAVFYLDKQSPAPASPPVAPTTPAKPIKPIAQQPAKTPSEKSPEQQSAAPAAALRSARVAISHRVEPLFEAHKRALKNNFTDLGKALQSLPSLRFESGVAAAIAGMHTSENRIPSALPSIFAKAEGADQLLADHIKKQTALDEGLATNLKSQSGVYILELQNQIEKLSKTGNQAAIDALEEEVRRINTEPEYFRSVMKR